MSRLQVLVSTMHQKDYGLLKKMKINSDAIIINQCDDNSTVYIEDDGVQMKWINSEERGLSQSRNKALENASSDVCVLADDDLEYLSNYQEIILEQFKLYPDADIIAFQVEGIEQTFKNYSPLPKRINFLTSMKISSVEVAFRLDAIKKANIKFNALFGAGSKFSMGEENIFLANCFNQGLKIIYVPVIIANLHIGDSTWFKGFNKEYFINRGAIFTAMSKKKSLLLICQFAVRKYKLYNNNLSFLKVVRYMLKGRKEYLSKHAGLNL